MVDHVDTWFPTKEACEEYIRSDILGAELGDLPGGDKAVPGPCASAITGLGSGCERAPVTGRRRARVAAVEDVDRHRPDVPRPAGRGRGPHRVRGGLAGPGGPDQAR